MTMLQTGMRISLIAGALCAALPAVAQKPGAKPPTKIERNQSNANSPIAAYVSVPAAANLVFLSGSTASPPDPAKPDEMGDTKAQTLNILTKMKATVEGLGLTMGDIVKVNVFLVGVPANGGRMDSAGMNEVFRTFFGTAEQPNKPARSTVQVAALGRPTTLVEIEAIVAKLP